MSLSGVFIDSRESQQIKALRFGGVPTVVTMLDYGDLWASTDDGALLIVERKTPSDLLGSIKDNRLFAQAAACREHSPWVYLCVTGLLTHTLDGKVVAGNRSTGWDWDSVQGALLTVQELGVSLIHCQSDDHYEDTVIRLARRERDKSTVIKPKLSAHVLNPAEQILMSFPGIGLERAQVLLEEFGDCAGLAIGWLSEYGTEHEVAGIGNGTKRKVREALRLADDEWIGVVNQKAAAMAVAYMTAMECEQIEQTKTPVSGR